MIVDLTIEEYAVAQCAAAIRCVACASRQARIGYGANPNDVPMITTLGVAGEIAVAKALNLYWSGNIGVAAPDVGLNIQVRTVATPNRRLIVHRADPDDAPFVLVYPTDSPQRFQLVGYLFGRDAKNDRWWDDPQGGRPAFFVPVNQLRPIEELRSAVAAEDCELF